MLSEGRIQTTDLPGQEGASGPLRLGKSFSAAVMDAHARYYDAVRRGNVFLSANTAALALSVNSTTATGLILYNPLNSGKSLVLLEVCVALSSLPAGASLLVLTGGAQPAAPTGVTLVTSGNNGVQSAYPGKFSNAASVALVYSAATIANAAIARWIGGGPAATVAGSTSFPPFIRDEIAGAIVLAPGQVISLQAVTTAITVGASMTWEEVPAS
jgi:hypothetical protein